MDRSRLPLCWRWAGLAGAAALAVGIAAGPPANAQPLLTPPPPAASPAPAVKPGVPQVTELTLAECLAMAQERRPALRAAQESLRAAELGQQALSNLGPIAERLSPDLPIRREQSARGVVTAMAEVQKVSQEMTQDITTTYFSYVYALQSQQTAERVIEQMEVYYATAKAIVDAGFRGPKVKLDQFTLYQLQNLIGDVRQQRVRAESGKRLALEALKQAMGTDPGFEFVPATKQLPEMFAGTVTREQVLADALARRPELVQAAAGVDAFRLEVCAQARLKYRPSGATLASGSDLHARLIPTAVRNGEYKPGGVAPEMPPNLVGKQEDRVARAAALSRRQDAVYEEAVNLVRLDAARAYLNWESATRRAEEAKRKFETSLRMVDETRSAAIAREDPSLLVTNEALAGKAQADYVEAVFDHVKALAALERVTAGAVFPRFPSR